MDLSHSLDQDGAKTFWDVACRPVLERVERIPGRRERDGDGEKEKREKVCAHCSLARQLIANVCVQSSVEKVRPSSAGANCGSKKSSWPLPHHHHGCEAARMAVIATVSRQGENKTVFRSTWQEILQPWPWRPGEEKYGKEILRKVLFLFLRGRTRQIGFFCSVFIILVSCFSLNVWGKV